MKRPRTCGRFGREMLTIGAGKWSWRSVFSGAKPAGHAHVSRPTLRAAADGNCLMGGACQLRSGADGRGNHGAQDRQKEHDPTQAITAGWAPQSVVAETMEARRRNVLEAAADKFHRLQTQCARLTAGGVAVTKGDGRG
jgi:hypothetical protein